MDVDDSWNGTTEYCCWANYSKLRRPDGRWRTPYISSCPPGFWVLSLGSNLYFLFGGTVLTFGMGVICLWGAGFLATPFVMRKLYIINLMCFLGATRVLETSGIPGTGTPSFYSVFIHRIQCEKMHWKCIEHPFKNRWISCCECALLIDRLLITGISSISGTVLVIIPLGKSQPMLDESTLVKIHLLECYLIMI